MRACTFCSSKPNLNRGIPAKNIKRVRGTSTQNRREDGKDSTKCLQGEVHFGTVIQHQDQGTANAADHVGQEPLVESSGQAFLGSNLLEAVHRAFVNVLLRRLL
eukprot:TRINITY_DN6935_c0_g1_i2.p1 TRINITY_DN6935_c0_g1~~TRINITY_DN6935_c0_g1_i2.p1  ORF type:complete len:104 (+),score=13.44 TRINITY_DN6935_c0_g1_i2:354-665(+)